MSDYNDYYDKDGNPRTCSNHIIIRILKNNQVIIWK